jgi:hypothetical protein
VHHFLAPQSAVPHFAAIANALREIVLNQDAYDKQSYAPTNLNEVLPWTSTRLRSPTKVFVISDFFPLPNESALRSLGRHDLVCVHLNAFHVPVHGMLRVRDAEGQATKVIDVSGKRGATRLQKLREQHSLALSDLCKRVGATYLLLQEKADEQLLLFMRRRSIR